LGGLELFYQVDSFLYVSLFRFQQVNETYTINSAIHKFTIYGYNYKLDTGLLNPLVFENNFYILKFHGQINSIQKDLFAKLHVDNNYMAITFSMNSLGSFYHKIGVQWMVYLKEGSHINMDSSNIPYNYPDSDFCIFAHLNNSLQTQMYLLIQIPINHTLTAMWLCLNWWDSSVGQNPPCSNWTLNYTAVYKMLNLCQIKDTENALQEQSNLYSTYPDYYQTRLVAMLTIELIPFVLIPCACLTGLYLNWKIIRTLEENSKTVLKEDFYKYMSANAKFNCTYCMIFVFYPMTSCTWNLSYHFCSSIYTDQFVQYYKIVMIAYFGEVVKMCANISYLMMTLNRYLLVGKYHAPWLVKLAKIEFKRVIRWSFLFSVLVNIAHGWEYQSVNDLVVGLNMKSSVYLKLYNYVRANGYSYSEYPEANKETWYLIYSICYFVINFGAFFILNTGVEVKIVRRMHKELKEKRQRLARMNATKPSLPSTSLKKEEPETSQEDKDKKKAEDEDGIKERQVIKMVIFNGVFNFILRGPDILFWMENKNIVSCFYSGSYEHVDLTWNNEENMHNERTPGLLNLIADIAYLTYILTFTTNFVIFYNFNKNFKQAIVFPWTAKNQNDFFLITFCVNFIIHFESARRVETSKKRVRKLTVDIS
jgi:hypothetical protein